MPALTFDFPKLRARLIDCAANYAQDDIGHFFSSLSDEVIAESPWIEFSHTPQIPHMGIVRLFLVAAREARQRNGILVYWVNDQLPAKLLPESRYIPVILNGSAVAKPPAFGIGKKLQSAAMACVGAPDAEALERFEKRWTELLGPAATRQWLDELVLSAADASSLAAWLTRVTLRTLGLNVLVLSTWKCATGLADVFSDLARNFPDRFWRHCTECGYRAGRLDAEEDCSNCGAVQAAHRLVPDVVGRQMFMNLAGIELRVSGRPKPYQKEADELTVRATGRTAPPRLRVTGRTVVQEVAGQAIERCNLLQALPITGSHSVCWDPPLDPDQDWLVSAVA